MTYLMLIFLALYIAGKLAGITDPYLVLFTIAPACLIARSLIRERRERAESPAGRSQG